MLFGFTITPLESVLCAESEQLFMDSLFRNDHVRCEQQLATEARVVVLSDEAAQFPTEEAIDNTPLNARRREPAEHFAHVDRSGSGHVGQRTYSRRTGVRTR